MPETVVVAGGDAGTLTGAVPLIISDPYTFDMMTVQIPYPDFTVPSRVSYATQKFAVIQDYYNFVSGQQPVNFREMVLESIWSSVQNNPGWSQLYKTTSATPAILADLPEQSVNFGVASKRVLFTLFEGGDLLDKWWGSKDFAKYGQFFFSGAEPSGNVNFINMPLQAFTADAPFDSIRLFLSPGIKVFCRAYAGANPPLLQWSDSLGSGTYPDPPRDLWRLH